MSQDATTQTVMPVGPDGQMPAEGRVSLDGNQWTQDSVRLVGDTFDESGGIDPLLWTVNAGGTATITMAGGEVLLATGLGFGVASQLIALASRRAVLLYGTTNNWTAYVRTGDTGLAGNVRRWGVYDANNGFFFELSGAVLNVVTRRAGVDTQVASANWTALPGYAIDTNYHRYEITWRGNFVSFWIDGLLAHVIGPVTAQSLVQATTLPIEFENNNPGTATDLHLFVRETATERRGSRRGNLKTGGVSASTTLKTGPGRLERILLAQSLAVGSLTIFDSTVPAGTTIITINSPWTAPVDIDLGYDFATGLSVGLFGLGGPTLLFLFYE